MKYTISCVYALLLFLLLNACHPKEVNDGEGKAFSVAAEVQLDSTIVLDHLVIYSDNHVNLSVDSLILSPQGMLDYEGRAAGLNELYLCSDHGELCRFYASGGMAVDFSLRNSGDSLLVAFTASEHDTINAWLQEQRQSLADVAPQQLKDRLDELCHQHPDDVRNALLLRDEVVAVGDSLFVRRCLGALSDEAKPNWLLKSIDQLLVEISNFWYENRRLKGCVFEADSAQFDFGATRSDYLLVYIWANYSQTSIDSLSVIDDLVNYEYDMKRLQLFTCCLDAADSTSWRQQIQGIEGTHAWIKAGLADKRLYNWGIDGVPTLVLCDMYNNQQIRNVWGEKLRYAIECVPNKSGFSHTPKLKPNGRPNNLSRPARN